MHQSIQEGGDVNGGALCLAVRNKKYDAAEFLLDRGADANADRGQEDNPLRLAVKNGDERMVRLLTEYGAIALQRIDHDGEGSLLHIAVSKRGSGARLVQRLLWKGADPNAQTPEGDTPLMHTTTAYVANLLLDAGADVNLANVNGFTALHYSGHEGALEVVAVLLVRGADANKVTKGGFIARYCAERQNDSQRCAQVVALLDAHQRRQLLRRLVDVCATLTFVGAPVLVLLECFSWLATETLGPVELPLELQWRIAARVRSALVAQQGVVYC